MKKENKHSYCVWTVVVCDGNAGWHILKRKCDDSVDAGTLGSVEAFCDDLRNEFGQGCVCAYYREKDIVERAYR